MLLMSCLHGSVHNINIHISCIKSVKIRSQKKFLITDVYLYVMIFCKLNSSFIRMMTLKGGFYFFVSPLCFYYFLRSL